MMVMDFVSALMDSLISNCFLFKESPQQFLAIWTAEAGGISHIYCSTQCADSIPDVPRLQNGRDDSYSTRTRRHDTPCVSWRDPPYCQYKTAGTCLFDLAYQTGTSRCLPWM